MDLMQDANSFFETYLEKTYDFEDLKRHVQYFLYQYRKLSPGERNKIKNRLGYLTNAIKKNQRSLEWRSSEEYEKMIKLDLQVDKKLKNDAASLFPDDELMQELFCKERYLAYHVAEMSNLRRQFNRKVSVKG